MSAQSGTDGEIIIQFHGLPPHAERHAGPQLQTMPVIAHQPIGTERQNHGPIEHLSIDEGEAEAQPCPDAPRTFGSEAAVVVEAES